MDTIQPIPPQPLLEETKPTIKEPKLTRLLFKSKILPVAVGLLLISATIALGAGFKWYLYPTKVTNPQDNLNLVQSSESPFSSPISIASDSAETMGFVVPEPTPLVVPSTNKHSTPKTTPTPPLLSNTDLIIERIHLISDAPLSASNKQGDTYVHTEVFGFYQYSFVGFIKNNGPTNTGPVTWKLYSNDSQIGTGYFDNIEVGHEKTVSQLFGNEIGTYSLRLELTLDSGSVLDNNLANNLITEKFQIVPEKVAPTIHLSTVKYIETQQTCVNPMVLDNGTKESELKMEAKLDNESYQTIVYRPDPGAYENYERCLTGPAGESHVFSMRVTDKRGNTAEQSLNFVLSSF